MKMKQKLYFYKDCTSISFSMSKYVKGFYSSIEDWSRSLSYIERIVSLGAEGGVVSV